MLVDLYYTFKDRQGNNLKAVGTETVLENVASRLIDIVRNQAPNFNENTAVSLKNVMILFEEALIKPPADLTFELILETIIDNYDSDNIKDFTILQSFEDMITSGTRKVELSKVQIDFILQVALKMPAKGMPAKRALISALQSKKDLVIDETKKISKAKRGSKTPTTSGAAKK